MSRPRVASVLLLASAIACVRDANSATDQRTRRTTSDVVKSAASSADDSTLVARRLWVTDAGAVADISADGRTVLLDSAGRLRLRDIASGVMRPLVGSDSGFITAGRFSRDGDRVFYARHVSAPRFDTLELRVRLIETGEDRLVQRFSGRNAWIDFGDEAPDGSAIYMALRADDWTWQLARASLANGNVTTLKSFRWRSPGAPRLSPKGDFIAYDVSPDERSNKRDVYLLAADGSREIQLTRTPENDRVLGWVRNGAGVLVTRDEDGSRDLREIAIARGPRAGSEHVVRHDVIAMQALRVSGDRLFYLVSNRSRDIVSAPIGSDTGPEPMSATTMFRTLDWLTYAVSPDGARLVYFAAGENDGNGPISIFVRSLSTGDEREVILPLDYIWTLSWTSRPQELIAVAQKRGRDELYRIDLRDASATLIPNGTNPCGGEPLRLIPMTSADGNVTYYLRQQTPGPRADLVACAGRGDARVMLSGTLLPPGYALSPDSRQLAIIEHRADTSVVHVIPVGSSGVASTSHRFAGNQRFDRIAGWTADGHGLVFARDLGETGGELWQLPAGGDAKPSRVFRTDRGRNPSFVPALGRAVYIVPHRQPDELWVLGQRP